MKKRLLTPPGSPAWFRAPAASPVSRWPRRPLLALLALRTVLADRAGYFTLSPAAGRYSLRATALGYDTTSTRPFDLEAAEAMQVQLSLGVRALKLAPLTVVARQRDTRWRDLHDYYGRIERHRRLHIGWIATR